MRKFEKKFMSIAPHITELLHHHNCVVVPNFGGFIANYTSATIHPIDRRIWPPSKHVLFNPKLINNDGLLGQTIAEVDQISYPKALDFIGESVKKWQSDLAKGKRIEIGEIGFLVQENGQVLFEQTREINLLLQAYGLSSIQFTSFAETVTEKSETNLPQAVVEDDHQILEIATLQEAKIIPLVATDSKPDGAVIIPIQEKKKSSTWKYLGAAAAIPLLFYSYWIPVQTDFIDTGKIQLADFNPIHQTPQRVFEMRTNVQELPSISEFPAWEELTKTVADSDASIFNYQVDEDFFIPILLDKTKTSVVEDQTALHQPETSSAADKSFHLIGGCFSIKQNADNFVLDLKEKGFNASILDFENGLYRVAAGSFSDASEAGQNLIMFVNQGFSGWVLKK
jgi:hypothetical protein